MNPLALLGLVRRIPLWVWPLLAALAMAGWQWHRATSLQAELAQVRAEHAQEETRRALAAVKATDQAIEETERRIAAQGEADHVAQLARDRAADDRRAADAEHVRLLDAARAAAARGQAGGDPAVAASGPPAGTAANLLVDVLERLDSAAGELASYADAARIAGQQCQADYDALRPAEP
jgi:hypothetical protein